jgi:hypothetical protein
LFKNNTIISSFGKVKTQKKVEFFPPLGGIKRGYPEEQDHAKTVSFRDQSPSAASRHLPLRGRKNSSKCSTNPPLGGKGGKKDRDIGSWGAGE